MSKLHDKGLYILGKFSPTEDENLLPGKAKQPSMILIVGNVGSSIWPIFETARKQRPDLTLDRWTKVTIDHIITPFDIKALYPFEGPPYWPFTRWALRTGILFTSPLGLTVHPAFGLWHAFRAALLCDASAVVDDLPALPEGLTNESPCNTCADRPCLGTCPVAAFDEGGYDFDACLDHVATPSNACRQGACLARAACPVGHRHRYDQDHARFHMTELLKAHGRA